MRHVLVERQRPTCFIESLVTSSRECFTEAVFVVRAPDGVRNYYCFLFASQRLAFAYFLRCHAEALPEMQKDAEIWKSDLRGPQTFMWLFQPDDFTCEDIFGGRGANDVDVIMHSTFLDRQSLESHHDAYRLRDVLASLPAPLRHQDAKPRGGGAQSSGTTPAEHTSDGSLVGAAMEQLQDHVSSTSSKNSVNVASATEELSMWSDEDGEEHASPFMRKVLNSQVQTLRIGKPEIANRPFAKKISLVAVFFFPTKILRW
eukprot:950704-Amphidinium_carterae.1